MNIIFFTSFHPNKLDPKFWNIRELEYIHTLKYFRDFPRECFIFDNSIDSITDLIEDDIISLITKKDFPFQIHNNFFSKSSYNSNNTLGYLELLELLIENFSDNSSFPLTVINGRILNYETLLSKLPEFLRNDNLKTNKAILFKSRRSSNPKNHSEEIMYFSNTKSLLTYTSNLKLKVFSCGKNLVDGLNELVEEGKIKVIEHHMIILKHFHTNKSNYAITEMKCI